MNDPTKNCIAGSYTQAMRFLNAIAAIALIITATNAPGIALETQADPDWQMICTGRVRPFSKRLKFDANTHSVVKETIQLCTKYVYDFSGRMSQRINVRLEGSKRTRMILDQKKGNRLFSELREWEGVLPQNGKYQLIIVTAETAPYSIEIGFR